MTAGARRCLIIVILLVVPAILAVLGLANAARWLHTVDEPRTADAIIVLAGEPFRASHAADLFKAGYAPRVLVSRPLRNPSEKMLDDLGISFPRAENVYAQVLTKLGVPAEHIVIFGMDSISTVDEALALRRMFAGAPVRLLIVTFPFHTRRTRMIFHDYLPGFEIHVVATPYEPYPDAWWKSQDAARNVVLELSKILFYIGGGRFSAGS